MTTTQKLTRVVFFSFSVVHILSLDVSAVKRLNDAVPHDNQVIASARCLKKNPAMRQVKAKVSKKCFMKLGYVSIMKSFYLPPTLFLCS